MRDFDKQRHFGKDASNPAEKFDMYGFNYGKRLKHIRILKNIQYYL